MFVILPCGAFFELLHCDEGGMNVLRARLGA